MRRGVLLVVEDDALIRWRLAENSEVIDLVKNLTWKTHEVAFAGAHGDDADAALVGWSNPVFSDDGVLGDLKSRGKTSSY